MPFFILVSFLQYIFLECIYICMNSWNTLLWIPANIFMMNKDDCQKKIFLLFSIFFCTEIPEKPLESIHFLAFLSTDLCWSFCFLYTFFFFQLEIVFRCFPFAKYEKCIWINQKPYCPPLIFTSLPFDLTRKTTCVKPVSII